jgi:hypothetical protein
MYSYCPYDIKDVVETALLTFATVPLFMLYAYHAGLRDAGFFKKPDPYKEAMDIMQKISDKKISERVFSKIEKEDM